MRTTLVYENGLSGQQPIAAAWSVATQGAENNRIGGYALMLGRFSLDAGRARPPNE
jgi:hypothetical protein